jgi:ribonuclease HI
VFQVIHKSTLKAIDLEWKRRPPRKAHQMYEEMKRTVNRLVKDRWEETGGGETFASTWLDTGLVQIKGRGRIMTHRMWAKDMKPEMAKAKEKGTTKTAAPQGILEIYTDGTGGKGREDGGAGWGWVAVKHGKEIMAGSGGVCLDTNHQAWEGAEKGTNNTAEITAVIRALAWAREQREKEVCIRYDSEYAASMTQGKWRPRQNKALVARAKEALRATEKSVTVYWSHIKGHSGDKWNDRADALADEGARTAAKEAGAGGESDETPGKLRAGAGDATGVPRLAKPKLGGDVRWVTYQPTETGRVVRSKTDFGTLNLPTPRQQVLPGAEIRKAAAECLREIGRERDAGETGGTEAWVAQGKVQGAARRLQNAANQRRDIQARARTDTPTHELDCDIDIRGLEAYLESNGGKAMGAGGQTQRQAAEKLLKTARQVDETTARIRLEYHYSETGRNLWEAGHITGSREMTRGPDPFRWPKQMREAALAAIGAEFDDKSCYPVAWRAMRGSGGQMTDMFVKNKGEVLAVGGAYLWPDASEEDQYARMKSAMNALDNDGGLSSWKKKWPSPKTLAGKELPLQSGEKFEPSTYKKEQTATTEAAMKDSPRALQYLQRMWANKAGKKDERARRMAWKSYILQEAEAVSREAKLQWSWQHGVRVVNLQHDGIVAMVSGDQQEQERAAQAMAQMATARCGFEVRIEPKVGRVWAS